MSEILLTALKRLFLGVRDEEEKLTPLSRYSIFAPVQERRAVMAQRAQMLVIGAVLLTAILLVLQAKRAFTAALPVAVTPTHPIETWTPTPIPSPTPTVALTPTETPSLTLPWQPNLAEAEKYQRECQGVNAVYHPLWHEQASARVMFLPDYEAAMVAASCNYVTYGINRPQAIVVHHTGYGTLAGALSWLRKLDGAGAHYLIDRDGEVYQLIPEAVGARHVTCAGNSCIPSCPEYLCREGYPELLSISIELLNWGYIDPGEPGVLVYEDYLASFGRKYWEDYTDMQLLSLKGLVYDIAERWGIPIDPEHVLGHYRINQKVDPGPALNLFWERIGYPPREALFP